MPITKLASDILNDKSPDVRNYANAAEGILGAYVLSGAKDRQLRGRTKLYHGTTDVALKSILENGLAPSSEENALNTARLKADPARYKNALGKVYTTRHLDKARSYAWQSSLNNKNARRGAVVELDVPMWKLKRVVNPEADMSFDEYMRRTYPGLPKETHAYHKPAYRRFRQDVVFEGGISPEYIKGSRKYRYFNPKELLEYARHNPKVFAKAWGKVGLGLGMLGHAAYSLYDRNKGDILY